MKTKIPIALLLLLAALNLQISTSRAATTIDATNKYAYGANIGWIDCRGDTNNGAVIGEYVCSGYIYSANCGWINLGNGSPANGIQYQNNAANDFGVNTDGLGNLRGYAYGANIGWINFETNGAAKVDLLTGKLSGYAYSANCGWISLSNALAYVKTTTINKGSDTNSNNLPDAWERLNFGFVGVSPNADADGDGASNLDEYLAGTNPNDPNDKLKITLYSHGPTATYNTLQWNSQPTRAYAIQYRPAFSLASPWTDYFVFSNLGANNAGFDVVGTTNFFQIRAFRPLTP